VVVEVAAALVVDVVDPAEAVEVPDVLGIIGAFVLPLMSIEGEVSGSATAAVNVMSERMATKALVRHWARPSLTVARTQRI
jgi:hypothetical protein